METVTVAVLRWGTSAISQLVVRTYVHCTCYLNGVRCVFLENTRAVCSAPSRSRASAPIAADVFYIASLI
jgi:hypothetical protein